MKRVLTTGAAALTAAALAIGTGMVPAAASSAGGSLDVWIMGDAGTAFETLIAPFVDETGITVNVESIPWENVNDKLTTAVASGSGPDLVQIGLSNLAAFQAAGVLTDLAPHADGHPALDASLYLEAVATASLGDTAYSVPWISDTRVLFYRTDLLAEVGIDAAPTTWDELHAAATALADRDGGEYGYYIPQWDQALPAVFTWQAGGSIVDDSGVVTFDSDEFRTAADFYLGLYADGLVPTAGDWDQTLGFITGQAPMLISGPYLAQSISDVAPELDGSWAVAPVPAGPAAGTSLFAGSNLGVWNGTDNLDGALALLDFLAGPETQVAWYAATSQLPTVTAALEDPSIADDPLAAVYAAQLADAELIPLVANWDQLAQELLNALNGIALTGADRDSTLAALNESVAALQQ